MKDYLFLEGEELRWNAETRANACGLDALSGVHNLKGRAAPAAAPNLS
jgi:hypothetical protein